MAESAGTQRFYRAPCPGCGAPVEFRSAQSLYAVCPYCQSTVVRRGETLARVGKMAELFDDFSPLQLFASGHVQATPFTLVGRLQYAYDGGRWTEWIAQLDGGERIGILSEDNGAFVFALPLEPIEPLPPYPHLRVGMTTAVNGRNYTVASSQSVSLVSAQGELPRLPELGRRFQAVELRNEEGHVLSLDYDTDPPSAYLGRAVQLDELRLSGLKGETVREEQGRVFNCPNCGAPIRLNLENSRSVTCGSCQSIIDLKAGIGGELHFATQDEPVKPLIALGSIGQFIGAPWQVVGFQHRIGVAPDDDEDEHFGWNEYLLYNRQRGFSFLVDAEDGWSLVKPTTGAPKLLASGQQAKYLGKTYRLQYAYQAETSYVLGEFYWQVERGQRSFNRDFANATGLLSMEQSPREVTWSSGDRIDSDAVAAAFRLYARKDLFKRGDASPVSVASGMGCGTVIVLLIVLFLVGPLLFALIFGGASGSSGGYRSSGGSYGGYSSGGYHK